MILRALKDHTAAQHREIEQAVELMRPDVTAETYRAYLRKVWGFYLPVESRLEHIFRREPSPLLDFGGRRKVPPLAADLRALGEETERLPVCTELPLLEVAAGGYGCLYVLEGATLGGQLIRRHLRATLGPDCERALGFLDPYREQVGPRWKAFGAALRDATDRAASTDWNERVLSAAAATFTRLTAWMRA